MDTDSGKRQCTIRRTSPVTKSSNTPPRTRSFAYGVEYGNEKSYNERAIDVREEDIYRTPEGKGTHVTSIHTGSSTDSRATSREAINSQFLSINTTPFSNRNGSARSPVRGPKHEKAEVSVNTLKRQSDVVKKASRTPSGDVCESSWAGTKLGGRVEGMTPNIRNYWQQNISKEQKEREEASRHIRPKSYGFPKWRSSDALSASLVASNPVEIPKDSRIPENRLRKMEQTDKEAEQTKELIQQSVPPSTRLHKGKSLESLVMQAEQNNWYDRNKIREAISRESIANIGEARQRFESGDFPSTRRDRTFSSTSSRLDPPPLPPKSEEVQIRQMANRLEHQISQDYSIENYQSPVSQSSTHKSNGYTPQQQVNGYGREIREPSYQLSTEQQLLLLYLKQNQELAHSLGIYIPDSLKQVLDELHWRKVELRCLDEESNSYLPQSYSPSQKGGRYVKKYQPTTAVYPPRFKKHETPRLEPRRDELRGESLIAAEIRSAREREEELRRSRSELGLPTLEDTMDLWRQGHRGIPAMNPLRTAVSYDHLMHNNSSNLQKASSIGELSHDSYSQFGRREENGSRHDVRQARNGYGAPAYKLQNTEDQDVMFYGPPRRNAAPLKKFY